jgi:hypothetical protein
MLLTRNFKSNYSVWLPLFILLFLLLDAEFQTESNLNTPRPSPMCSASEAGSTLSTLSPLASPRAYTSSECQTPSLEQLSLLPLNQSQADFNPKSPRANPRTNALLPSDSATLLQHPQPTGQSQSQSTQTVSNPNTPRSRSTSEGSVGPSVGSSLSSISQQPPTSSTLISCANVPLFWLPTVTVPTSTKNLVLENCFLAAIDRQTVFSHLVTLNLCKNRFSQVCFIFLLSFISDSHL